MYKINNCLYSGEMATLGENIEFLRERAGLTYEALGTGVGADSQTIFQLEKRKSKQSKYAHLLADYFGVDLNSLLSTDLSKSENLRNAQSKMHLVANTEMKQSPQDMDDAIEWLAILQQLNPRERDNVLDFARSIIGDVSLRWVKRTKHKS